MQRNKALRIRLLATACLFNFGWLATLPAQQDNTPERAGYVTAVHMPESIEIEGRTVLLSSSTTYVLENTKAEANNPALRNQIGIGSYLFVRALPEASEFRAHIIRIRDESFEERKGQSVILGLSGSGAQRLILADGYRIRITPDTQVDPSTSLQSLEAMKPGQWIEYHGKLGQDGVVTATRFRLLTAYTPRQRAISYFNLLPTADKDDNARHPVQSTTPNNRESDGTAMTEDRKLGDDRLVRADLPLQQRIHNLGLSLVPAYQRQLAEDDPAKIHFRFFVIEEREASAAACFPDGIILIPRLAIERLGTDERIAVVLAAGVAWQLHAQANDPLLENLRTRAVLAATTAASLSLGPYGLVTEIGLQVQDKRMQRRLSQQLARLSLALLADAGYDPHLAPEIWRDLYNRHPEKGTAKSSYPAYALYQLGFLHTLWNGEQSHFQ